MYGMLKSIDYILYCTLRYYFREAQSADMHYRWFILTLGITWGTALAEYFSFGRLYVTVPYAFVIPVFVILPRALYYTYARARNRASAEWLAKMERALFIIVGLNAPASLYLHNLGFQYDRFLHFAMGAVYFYAFVLLIAIFFEHPDILMRGTPFVALIVGGIAMAFLWEGSQYTLDQLFGIHLFSDRVQDIKRDFWEDIIFGILGGIITLTYLKHRLVSQVKGTSPREEASQ